LLLVSLEQKHLNENSTMKTSFIGMLLAVTALVGACTSVEVAPDTKTVAESSSFLIGKWLPTYIVQNAGETKWTTIQTFAALPTYEFTSTGKFLVNGKATEECCPRVGKTYSAKDGQITFSDFNSCPNVACIALAYDPWKFSQGTGDTLILQETTSRAKYIRAK
jgi:hypothetical protein